MAETVVVSLAELETVKFCGSCDTAYTEDDAIEEGGPLYECGNCGNVFTKEESEYGNHRCECGKYASKLYEEGAYCPDCREELEEREAVIGSGGEVMVIDTTGYAKLTEEGAR